MDIVIVEQGCEAEEALADIKGTSVNTPNAAVFFESQTDSRRRDTYRTTMHPLILRALT